MNQLSVFSLLSDLPEVLLVEILYRLPVKSVFMFKSVSKYWFSLISDPFFARTYYSRHPNPPWTIMYRYDGIPNLPQEVQILKPRRFESLNLTLDFLSRDFELPCTSHQDLLNDPGQDGKAPVIVLAVSNGLVLSAASRFFHACYYISNPFTRQYSALPRPLRIHRAVLVGLMVEPVDGSFQVVRIGNYEGSSTSLALEIFSSKTGEWKDKKAYFNLPVKIFHAGSAVTFMYMVSCKKILYWMEMCGRLIAYDTEQNVDNDDDTIQCHAIDLPGHHRKNSATSMIGVCQDNLVRYCHVQEYIQDNGFKIQELRVWELRKSNVEYWCLLYKIRMDEFVKESICVLCLGFDNPDLVYFQENQTGLFITLNLRTRVCRRLRRLKNVVNPKTVFQFVFLPWPTPVPRFS